MSEFVHVNLEQLEILCLVAFRFNIVVTIINVQAEQFVMPEYVRQFVHRIVTVLAINYVCKEFVNQLVTETQAVPTSNTAKTIFALKKFVADQMKIVYQVKTVLLMDMAVQNVEIRAKDEFCADAMQNVLPEVTMPYVLVKQDLLVMLKLDAVASNVNLIMIVLLINSVTRIFVYQLVNSEKRAVKKHYVQQIIIILFVIVNQDSVAILMFVAKQSIIAVTRLVLQEPLVQTIREHSIVLVQADMWAMHTTKDVVQHSNVQQITIAPTALSVKELRLDRNVEMFVKELCADQMLIAPLSLMLVLAFADQDTVEKPMTHA